MATIKPEDVKAPTCTIKDLLGVAGTFAPTNEEFKADVIKRLISLSAKNMKVAMIAKGEVKIPGLD